VLATLMIPVMNLALIVGVGTVMPLSLEGKFAPWTAAALSVAVALFLAPGPLAGLFVVPWLVLTVLSGIRALLGRQWWPAMVAGFAGTASLALLASRTEFTLFGITEPIVKLTALHFTYAGAGTLALALRLHRVRPGRGSSIARALVFLAPPVVALGFITHSALAQVGGASLMTAGVWSVALLQLPDARSGPRKWLWRISCLSPVIAMVLAVSWAAAQYWPAVPALIIPDMVPTHGALNAFGFVLCGHLAREREVTSP
jgi:hypothetical protein